MSSSSSSSIFNNSLLPPLVTLLNSAAHPALSPLWKVRTDSRLAEDSGVVVLRDDDEMNDGAAGTSCRDVRRGWEEEDAEQPSDTSEQAAHELTSNDLAIVPRRRTHGNLAEPVIHIQSPTLRTTYIQAGSSPTSTHITSNHHHNKKHGDTLHISDEDDEAEQELALGITLPRLGIQIRPLAARELVLEIGVADARGVQARVRVSSFQTTPSVRFPSPSSKSKTAILHLPLKFASSGSAPLLTPWMEISLDLPSLVPLFQSRDLAPQDIASSPDHQHQPPPVPIPQSFHSVSYIRIYANCRVRKVWMSTADAVQREKMGSGVQADWGMYAVR